MKRFLFAFTLILITATCAIAQQNEAEKAADTDAIIKVVGEPVHDFGTIKEADGPVTYTFKVKNEGKSPLVITKVVPSCGCTTPDWTKEPIAPGKTGDIKVTYDPAGRPAPFQKTISVYSNGKYDNGKTGSYVLTIKGVVEGKQ